MKYLFSLIFSLNIIFYIFLIFKPLNIDSDFSIEKGDKLKEIFSILEEKNIYLPKAIKLIFNVSGKDKKIYLGKYKINTNESLVDIFKKIYFGKIVLKKFIVPEGSKITDLFSKEIIKSYCQTFNFQNDCELEGYVKPDIYFYDRESELLSILRKSIDKQKIDLNNSWKERNNKLNNFSKKEILIIASILEKESCANEREKISGTVQNDILKEYISRGLYIFPPEHSIRLTTDLMSWCKTNAPRWNTISVSGYHMREAGCTASQEIALTLSNALFYARKAIQCGMEIDDFAPRMSFFFACHNNFIQEIAKFRAARQLWNTLVEEEFAPKNSKSSQLRFHTQTSGVTLTAQQPLNNSIRVGFQALAAVLGGTQSLHTNSYDEALGLPTEESAKLALRTQQIIAEESGITSFVDPLGGSQAVEEKTDELIESARKTIEEIDALGGAMECVKSGYQQKIIHESAWDQLKKIESKEELVVGVNSHIEKTPSDFEGLLIDSTDETSKKNELAKIRESRNNNSVDKALLELRERCKDGTNVMDSIISAVKLEATVGEINSVFREEFGTWVSPSGV